MIILHSHLLPQFKMNYFIYFTSPPVLFVFQLILVMAQKAKVLHMHLIFMNFCYYYYFFLFHDKQRGFIPVEIQLKFLSIHIFFSDYIKNKYKNTKKLKSCLRLSSRRLLNIHDVIYMTKKNHSQGLRSCITKLSFLF